MNIFNYYLTVKGNRTAPGTSVGVAVADSPTDPFQDAIGKPLGRDGMTPRARRPWEDIDPTVWIDEDRWTTRRIGPLRRVCVKYLDLCPDGTIKPITQTEAGVSVLRKK